VPWLSPEESVREMDRMLQTPACFEDSRDQLRVDQQHDSSPAGNQRMDPKQLERPGVVPSKQLERPGVVPSKQLERPGVAPSCQLLLSVADYQCVLAAADKLKDARSRLSPQSSGFRAILARSDAVMGLRGQLAQPHHDQLVAATIEGVVQDETNPNHVFLTVLADSATAGHPAGSVAVTLDRVGCSACIVNVS